MKKILLFCFLITGFQITRPVNALATGAAIATWLVVSPIASLATNTIPNPLWVVGAYLVGNDFASRYALGGIVGGTIGTLAAVCVYKSIKKA